MATAQDVLTRVREQISDSVADSSGAYRWSDAQLIRLISDGCFSIVGDHPEARYRTAVSVGELTDVTTATQTLELRTEYITPLVDFVVARVFSDDSEDLANLVLSTDHYKKSEQERD